MNGSGRNHQRTESRRTRSDSGNLPDSGVWQTPEVCWLCLLLLPVTLAGCSGSHDIETVYGQRTGSAGAPSVNGTSVFARMFEEAGARVSTWSRMSPRLKEYQVIVWAPHDFQPPTVDQRQFIEQWLWEGDGRTLIYIGRDYDAAISYWEKMLPSAPPGQVREITRRLAETRADYQAARAAMPAEKFCRWFTLRRDGAPRKVKSLSGSLSRGIDASRVEIELRARYDVPRVEDLQLHAHTEEEDSGEEVFDPWDAERELDAYIDPEQAIPSTQKVLLRSQDDPLVTQIKDHSFARNNQILVVTNGSFLLNLPLVNREHRKLAGRLIDLTGSPHKVAFLESGADGPRVLEEEPGSGMPTGLEALTVWPIGCILMHLAVVGILFCFAQYPIFGRPKEPPPDSVADFGKHIDAMGELLQRTGDPRFASERLGQYQQQVRGETGSPRVGISPTTKQNPIRDREMPMES